MRDFTQLQHFLRSERAESITLTITPSVITAAVTLLCLSDLPLCLSHLKSLTSQTISSLQHVCAVPQTTGLDLLDFAAPSQYKCLKIMVAVMLKTFLS